MITDTYNIAVLIIAQQALDGEISTGEAVKRMREAAEETELERLKRAGFPNPKSLPEWMRNK